MNNGANDITANGTSQITVSGGKAGEAVSWDISGNGSFTAKDATFNSSGVAYATVQGVAPYSEAINVSANGCAKSIGIRVLVWNGIVYADFNYNCIIGSEGGVTLTTFGYSVSNLRGNQSHLTISGGGVNSFVNTAFAIATVYPSGNYTVYYDGIAIYSGSYSFRGDMAVTNVTLGNVENHYSTVQIR